MTGRVVVAFAALYLVAALALGARRWDGFAPQPYRYVSPPAGVQNGGAPAAASGNVSFTNGESKQVQIFTSDLQAQLLVPAGAFLPSPAGGDVAITITPQAPPALRGLTAAGNVYVVQAKYSGGAPVPEPWKKPMMIYLRFPDRTLPSGLYRLDSGQPVKLSAGVDVPTLTAQGQTDRGGSFLAAGVAAGAPAAPNRRPALLLGGTGVALIVIALVLLGRAWFTRERPDAAAEAGDSAAEALEHRDAGVRRAHRRRRRR